MEIVEMEIMVEESYKHKEGMAMKLAEEDEIYKHREVVEVIF